MAPIELFLGRMLLWNNCLKTFEELLIYFTFFMKPRGVKNLDGWVLLGSENRVIPRAIGL